MNKKSINVSKKKDNKRFVALVICIVMAVVTIIGSSIVAFKFITANNNSSSNLDDIRKKQQEADLATDYVNEVKYIGGIGYPQVYNIPFQQNETAEYYHNNKHLCQDHYSLVQTAVEQSREFMETLFNTGYHAMMENPSSYKNDLIKYMDENRIYGWVENEAGGNASTDEVIDIWMNYCVENELEVEATFLIDESLCWEDSYIYTRGILEFEVFSSKIPEIPADGIKKAVVINLRMYRSPEDPSNIQIVEMWQQGPILDAN